jgi:hypothetical protein
MTSPPTNPTQRTSAIRPRHNPEIALASISLKSRKHLAATTELPSLSSAAIPNLAQRAVCSSSLGLTPCRTQMRFPRRAAPAQDDSPIEIPNKQIGIFLPKHLATCAMSDTTSPRFGPCRGPVGALLAGAQTFECVAPRGTRRQIARTRKTASVSLPRRRPGENKFCNNKFA